MIFIIISKQIKSLSIFCIRTGPSPGFSSRGGHIFKIQYRIYAATGGPNAKLGWPGTTGLPAGDGPAYEYFKVIITIQI